jgi:hypothetical protein
MNTSDGLTETNADSLVEWEIPPGRERVGVPRTNHVPDDALRDTRTSVQNSPPGDDPERTSDTRSPTVAVRSAVPPVSARR